MFAAVIFFLFFLVIYLTRPNRKKSRYYKKTIPKPNLKPTIEQARQQAMTNFWLQALAQSQPQLKQTNIPTETVAEILVKPILEKPAEEIMQQDHHAAALHDSQPAITEKIINPLLAAARLEQDQPQEPVPDTETPTEVQAGTHAAFVQYLTAFAAKDKTTTGPPVPPASPHSSADPSIIDVSPDVKPILYEETEELVSYQPGVPKWAHRYVYDASEISDAGKEQQAFYQYFKKAFHEGKLIDLEGNTNYAFILYFELLGAYAKHYNITLLEKQLNELGRISPRTTPYGRSFLVGKMRAAGDHDNANRLQDFWDWRQRYGHKMKLSAGELEQLSFIYLSSNSFINIEFCAINVLRLYLEFINILQEQYRKADTNIESEFLFIMEVIARKQHRYEPGSSNYQYTRTHTHPIYEYILRFAESTLREHYRYSRKISIEGYFTNEEVKSTLAEKIDAHLETALSSILQQIPAPTETVETELNVINPARWRSAIDSAMQSYAAKDLLPLETLVRQNARNPSSDLLFYEISRQMIPVSKSEALTYYFRHFERAKRLKKVWKLPTAAMNKQLFKTTEEPLRFYTYFNEFTLAPDIEKGIAFAQGFFAPIRKKINLDAAAIQQAETLDSRTTELLSAYLGDEEEISVPITREEEIKAQTIQNEGQTIQTGAPQIKTTITLSDPALALLKEFRDQHFELSHETLEAICKTNGMMAAALINSINEAYYDLLDENLIEKEETQYSIQPDYYYQIVNT